MALANRREAARDRRNISSRSTKTVNDASPMTRSTPATAKAGGPMCSHISDQLNTISCLSSSASQLERHLKRAVHADRQSFVASGVVPPLLDRLHGSAGERLLAAHDLDASNGAVSQDDDLQEHRPGPAIGARLLRVLRDGIRLQRLRRDGVVRKLDRSSD